MLNTESNEISKTIAQFWANPDLENTTGVAMPAYLGVARLASESDPPPPDKELICVFPPNPKPEPDLICVKPDLICVAPAPEPEHPHHPKEDLICVAPKKH